MNTNPSLTPEQRAKRWGVAAKIAAVGLFGFFVAPFILQSIAGLLGLAVFAACCVGLWAFLPVVGSAAANLRLRLIKAEAAKNPVETLQNEFSRQSSALEERRLAIGELGGQIRTFSDKVENVRRKYGPADSAYQKLAEQLENLKKVFVNRQEKWTQARAQLERFEQEIERAGMIWEAAQAAARAQESSGLTEEDFMARLKTETSLDSIRTAFNESLASLDVDLMQANADKLINTPVQAALPSPNRDAINVTTPIVVALEQS